MKDTKKETPKIYVADLAAYVNGRLHGRWIEANQDPEDIHQEIQEMLAESPEPSAEEHAIHDYEHFGSFHLAEYEDIETVSPDVSSSGAKPGPSPPKRPGEFKIYLWWPRRCLPPSLC